MAKAILVMDMPDSCLHCERRSVIYADGKGYQHCAFDTNGYKLETFFKTEDLKEGFISRHCPLREIPEKKEILKSEQYLFGSLGLAFADGYNACIDEILGGGE